MWRNIRRWIKLNSPYCNTRLSYSPSNMRGFGSVPECICPLQVADSRT